VVVSFIGEETGVPEENHQPVASHWQTWVGFEPTSLVTDEVSHLNLLTMNHMVLYEWTDQSHGTLWMNWPITWDSMNELNM
jgi:hypothetical protein